MATPTITNIMVMSGVVNWQAPTSVAAIIEYQIQYEDADAVVTTVRDIAPTLRSYTLTGLDESRRVRVRIRARNAGGFGDWSDYVAFVTTLAPTCLLYTSDAADE